MRSKNYFYLIDEIVEIYNDLLNEKYFYKNKYWVATIICGIPILFVVLLVVFITKGWKECIDLLSIVAAISGLGNIIYFWIFVVKQDNKKYDFYYIERETIKDSLSGISSSKKAYHNMICEKFDNRLREESILYGNDNDIRVLDAYISQINTTVSKNTVIPLFIKGNVAFFIFFITIAAEINLLIFRSYRQFDSIFIAISVAVFLICISIFFIIHTASHFYENQTNKKMYRLDHINQYLIAIRNSRFYEHEATSEERKPITFSQVLSKIVDYLWLRK